jgi:streptogramin lyase
MHMRRRSLAAGVATALLLAVLVPLAAAGVAVQEAALNPTGTPLELNRDAAGNLYITDFGAGEVWVVDPSTSSYTVYEGLGPVVDARPDQGGAIWWTEWFAPVFGRIDVQAGTLTTWDLGGATIGQKPVARRGASRDARSLPAARRMPATPIQDPALWGVAFDDDGGVWLPESFGFSIYRFDPDTTELCAHSLPNGVDSAYVLFHDGVLWLGDASTQGVLRYDPSAEEATYWTVGGSSLPNGLTLDTGSNLWWADLGLRALARLEPNVDRLTTYALSPGSRPEMVAAQDGEIWFTDDGLNTVGVLDPSVATGTSTILDTETQTATVTCELLGVGTTIDLDTRSGELAWSGAEVTPITDTDGWLVYELPSGAAPYGVTSDAAALWATDYGWQKLLRFELGFAIYVPLVLNASGSH